jgi:thiamine monophosphate synthase
VAIGGITRERAPAVAAAGACAAAVISDVDLAPDRTAAAREVGAAFGTNP